MTKLRDFSDAMLLMLCFAILAYCFVATPLGRAMASEHLTEKLTKHERSIKHISNTVDLTMVGNVNIA